MKKTKTRKIHNKVKKVSKEKLFKLYNNLPYICQSCCYNALCPEIDNKKDTDSCKNYNRAIELNEIINRIQEQNIDLNRFCEKYKLKKEFLIEMLKSNILMNYKYYISLCNRLHFKEFDEFSKYEKRFELENKEGYKSNNEYENNTEGMSLK